VGGGETICRQGRRRSDRIESAIVPLWYHLAQSENANHQQIQQSHDFEINLAYLVDFWAF
jgi:hypothetical protein